MVGISGSAAGAFPTRSLYISACTNFAVRGICWVQHTQEEFFLRLTSYFRSTCHAEFSLAHFRLLWSCQMGIRGVLHQLHVDMEASDLRQEDQIGGYEEVGDVADVLRRQFAADFESSPFKLATVSGSNLCPSKDDIEFDISCSFLNIHQQQGVFWLLDSQEFLTPQGSTLWLKARFFAMFSFRRCEAEAQEVFVLGCSLCFVFAQILLRQVVHPHGYQCWSAKPQPSL